MILTYELSRAIYDIFDACLKGDKAQEEAQQAIKEIKADPDHSTSWKNQRIEEINKNLAEAFKQNVKPIEALAPFFTDIPKRAREGFSYDDPALQSAISMIELMKDKTTTEMRLDIVNRFRGNPSALEVITALFDRYNFYHGRSHAEAAKIFPDCAALEEAKSIFSEFAGIDEVFARFFAYATVSGYQEGIDVTVTPKWLSFEMRQLMHRFERAYGIKVSDVHPLIIALKEFQNKTTVALAKMRVGRFLDNYEKAIENGDAAVIEKGEKYLAEEFMKPIYLTVDNPNNLNYGKGISM